MIANTTDTNLTPEDRALVLQEAEIYRTAIREHEASATISHGDLMVLVRRMHPEVTFSRQTFGTEIGPATPDAMSEHVAVRVQSTFPNERWLAMPVARWHRWIAEFYRRELAKLASAYGLAE